MSARHVSASRLLHGYTMPRHRADQAQRCAVEAQRRGSDPIRAVQDLLDQQWPTIGPQERGALLRHAWSVVNLIGNSDVQSDHPNQLPGPR